MQNKRVDLRRIAFFATKIAFAAGVIYWLIRTGRLDFQVYGSLFSKSGGWLLVGVFASQTIALVFVLMRWWLLVRVQCLSLSLIDVLRTGFQGTFANLVVPGGLGLEGVRVLHLQRHHRQQLAVGVASLVIDKILGLVGVLILGIGGSLAYFFATREMWIAPALIFHLATLGGVVTLIAASCGFLPLQRIGFLARIQFLARAFDALLVYRHHRLSLTCAVMISVVGHFSSCIAACFGLAALGFSPPLLAVTTVMPLLIIIRMIPLTPLGLGVTDGAAEELFGLIGLPGGAEVQMLLRASGVLIFLFSGLAYLGRWHKRHSSKLVLTTITSN